MINTLILIISFVLSFLVFGKGHFTKRRVGKYGHPEYIDAMGYTVGFGILIWVIIHIIINKF